MARHRWTLALILICLPILATVITAFRVRDLPRTPHDSVDKKKCDDCDVVRKVHSVKPESDRHTYEDLNKAVKEKLKTINQKVDDDKHHKYVVISDERDDLDDEEDDLDHFVSRIKSFFSFGGDDDDDDDDNNASEDQDDDDNYASLQLIKKTAGKNSYEKQELQSAEIGKTISKDVSKKSQEEDDDSDDDNDDDDNDDDNDDGNDDDEDDDDGDDKNDIKLRRQRYLKSLEPKNIKTISTISEIKEPVISKLKKSYGTEVDDGDEEVSEFISGKKNNKVIHIKRSQSNSEPKSDNAKKPSSTVMLGKKIETNKDPFKKKDVNDEQILTENLSKVGLKPKLDIKSSIIKESKNIGHKLSDKKVRDDGDEEENYDDDNDHNKDKDKTKNKAHTGFFTKSDSKRQVKFKITKQMQSFSKEVLDKDDDDAIVQDDDDGGDDIDDDDDDSNDDNGDDDVSEDIKYDTLKTKIQQKVPVSNEKVLKKESSLKVTPRKERIENDKIVTKPTFENKKVETDKTDLKASDKKESKKTEKLKEKPESTILDKSISLKDDKNREESKSADDKVVKREREKNIEKPKSSREHNDKSSSREIFTKIEKKTINDKKKNDDHKDLNKLGKADSIKKYSEDKKVHKTSKEKLVDIQENESHLKHITDALHRRNLLKSEFEDLYAFFPTFAPNFSRIPNPECRRHGQIVLRQLRGTKLWALNMLDATAKIPSGILQGNGIQLGDFDQCLGSRARVQLESGSLVKVQGKYCLARLEVKAEHPDLETPVHLAQAKNLIRSRIEDPGHFVPRFSTLSWGICVPAACSSEDVELILKDAVKHYQHFSGVVLRVKVDEQDCRVEDGAEWWKEWVELPTALTLSFYGVIILLVVVATLQDFFGDTEQQDGDATEKKCDQKDSTQGNVKEDSAKSSGGFLSNFSLYYTIRKLMAPGTEEEIPCIHGVRAIATIALLVAHKFLPVAVTPYTNRLKVTEVASLPIWSWCRAGWMFTDCFLLLSGVLTAHRMSSDPDTGAPKRLFSRYLRLTPALLGVVLFYAYVWDNVSNGPMWGTLVTKNALVCRERWWWNMLYVQNYFGFEDMCAPQTHQMALDMQLTILGSFVVWVMQVRVGLGKVLLPGLHLLAVYSRYSTVRDHRLTLLAYHGVSVSQLHRTARLSYSSALHRSTPYLVGLSLGLALKDTAAHSKILRALGWLSSGALWCLVWWAGVDSGTTQYRYSASFAAQYAALAPVASALAISWVIYAVHSGTSGIVSQFLCCRPLAVISRLSYAIYLCQFIVFNTKVATIRSSTEFSVLSLIDVQEISAIIIVSAIITLTLVIPMQSLHKVFTFPTRPDTSEKRESVDKEIEKQVNHVKHKESVLETPPARHRQHLIAHREVLEEIPEVEIEYESQRDHEGLGEIMEEEEDEELGEESQMQDEDLEIIEEEGGEDDASWLDREEYTPRRSYSNDDDQDLDEWEWTANGNRNGAQNSRYSR